VTDENPWGRRDPYFSDQSDSERKQEYRDRPEPVRHDGPPRNTRDQHPNRSSRSEPQYRPAPHPDDRRHQDSRDNRRYESPAERNEYSNRDGQHDPVRRPPMRTYPFEFHGKAGEYFKIWIVNLFLTIITLYVYSAWAKVRTKRYFYGNTTVDGSSFEYHATGRQLVVGRLIAVALLIIYTVFRDINITVAAIALGALAILFPWALWRSLKFNARASSFRNIRFGFDGTASTPYGIFIATPIAIAILLASAFLIIKTINIDLQQLTNSGFGPYVSFLIPLLIFLSVPLLHKILISYSHNKHRYGISKFTANIKTSRIYGIYILSYFFLLVAFTVVAVISILVVKFVDIDLDFLTQMQSSDGLFWKVFSGAFGYLFIVAVSGLSIAYFKSAIRNHRYSATSIGSDLQLHSNTNLWSLWWLDTSNLFLLIFSVGLAYPLTKIRSAQYFASHTTLSVEGGLDSFTAEEKSRMNAMGEEMADAFDVEFDIGV